ncbi:MAG TPA: hypothetical protein VEI52_25865 [Terriglobales bacterium]|nr:hypothetical protein [Terriglobales bacterium]
MLKHSEHKVARLNRPPSRLEKRDWELWVLFSFTGILVSAGLLTILVGAAFRFEITVSRPLVIGLFVLLALLNTYLLTKRLQVRRVRQPLILTTLEWEAGSLHPRLRRSRALGQSGVADPSRELQPSEQRSGCPD